MYNGSAGSGFPDPRGGFGGWDQPQMGERNDPRLSEWIRLVLVVFFLRKTAVLGIFVATVLFTFIATFFFRPVYMAKAEILIKGREYDTVRETLGRAGAHIPHQLPAQSLVIDELQILTSSDLTENAVEMLADEFEPEDFRSSRIDLPNWLSAVLGAPKAAISGIKGLVSKPEPPATASQEDDFELQGVDPLASALSKLVELAPVKDSASIEINLRHNNPRFAQKALQAYLDSYIDQRRRVWLTGDTPWIFLRVKAEEAWAELELLQEELKERKSKLMSVTPAVEKERLSQQLAAAGMESDKLEVELAAIDRARSRLRNSSGARARAFQLPDGVNDAALEQVLIRIGGLEADRAEKLRTFAPDSPMIQQIDKQLGVLGSRYKEMASNLLRSRRAGIQERLDVLEDATATLGEKYLEAERAHDELSRVERQAALLRERVELLETNRSEWSLNREFKQITLPNVGMVTSPKVLPRPVFPKKSLILAASALLGLFMGMAFALVQELLDDSLKLPEQIPQELGIPVIGSFPLEGEA